MSTVSTWQDLLAVFLIRHSQAVTRGSLGSRRKSQSKKVASRSHEAVNYPNGLSYFARILIWLIVFRWWLHPLEVYV